MRTRLTSLAVTAAVLGGIAATGIATTGSVASAAPPPSAPAAAALSWIERELTNHGGSLPSSFDPTAPDWGLTIDAILALGGGGRATGAAATAATTALASHIGDYITGAAFGDPGTYAGPVGKSLVAATLQGADVHAFGGVDLEAKSRAALQTTGVHAGRFSDQGSNFGDFSNEFGQALNILGLSHTSAGVPAPAVEFLLAQQCPNGSFRLDFDTAPVTRGCTTDAAADSDATAFSLQALLALTPTPQILAAEQKAAAWLASIQDAATGGFGGTGPTAALNASTTGLASQVLRALGRTTAAARGEAYVTALQVTAANATGTPAAAEEGAIANNPGALATALASGIAAGARDQWRRATTQGVLAFGAPLWGEPVTAVVPVDPGRVLDTRGQPTVDGTHSGGGAVAAGTMVEVPIAGRAGVPVGADSAVLNVTADGATGPGFVTVFPCDQPRPLASSVNFRSADPVPNAVIAKLSATGTTCLFVGVNSTQLVVDVNGYFPAGTGYVSQSPARLLDTRGEPTVDGNQSGGGPLVAGTTLTLPIGGRAGVPTGAAAAVLNVTVDGATGPGFVTVFPCDQPRPLASNLNFRTGSTVANAVIATLTTAGKTCFYVGTNAAHLVVDVDGYFPTGTGFTSQAPARLLDTRGEATIDGTHSGGGPVAAGATVELPITGRAGVPAGATAAVLNVTAVGAAGPGVVTVYPCDQPRPLASNVNFLAADPVPNAVIAKLSATGTTCLYVGTNSTELVVDVNGSFA